MLLLVPTVTLRRSGRSQTWPNKRNFDTLAPEVKLRINGKEISEAATSDLVSVNVLEDVNAAGMFTFTLTVLGQ